MGACCDSSADSQKANSSSPYKKQSLLNVTCWQDRFFKSENIALYSTEAESRDQRISDVVYRLLLNLSDSEKTGYNGVIRMTFSLSRGFSNTKANPLFVDFQGQEISKLKINGWYAKQQEIRFENHRIYLPEVGRLQVGDNTVEF